MVPVPSKFLLLQVLFHLLFYLHPLLLLVLPLLQIPHHLLFLCLLPRIPLLNENPPLPPHDPVIQTATKAIA